MIKLHEYELSGSCYKVRLLLALLGVPWQRVAVDYYPGREHRQPDFARLNPLRQLPVLEDGELVLRDAQAILVYLASKYDAGRRWYPEDAATRGRIAMWLAFAGGELMSVSAARLASMLVGYQHIDVERARATAHEALQILDTHLAECEFIGQQWLAAPHPTIADIACFPYAALSYDGGVERTGYHQLNRWLRRVRRLPGFIVMPGIANVL